MNLGLCGRQSEIQQMLARGHWPHACPPELRAHLSACRGCAELLAVTQAFQQSRSAAAAEAQLPAAGAIWWRAQLRRRNAAIERIGKPIVGAYVFALCLTLAGAGVLAITQGRHIVHWLDWVGQAQISMRMASASAGSTSGPDLLVLIPVLATLVLVGAVVAYLAAERQ